MTDQPTAAADIAGPIPDADEGWEWARAETFGHRSHYGRCREVERFGAKMLRIDIPIDGAPETKGWTTHFYPGSALFSYTVTTMEAVLKANRPYVSAYLARYQGDPEDDADEQETEIAVEIAADEVKFPKTTRDRSDENKPAVARDLINECERRVTRIVGDFEGLCYDVDTVFAMRVFVTSTLLAALCGMTIARAGQDLTADNIETAACELLEAMLPMLRRAGS